jgi:ribosomal-protein-alanine N-acetyltransferase
VTTPSFTILSEIHRAAFSDASRPWSAEEVRDLLAGDGARLIDAGDGFAIIRRAADEAELVTLAVRPECWGRGVGRALLVDALRAAAEEGASAMFLEVDVANVRAVALYRCAGFGEVGRRPRYYRRRDGTASDAIVMRRDLAV